MKRHQLIEARKNHGWTQALVAERLGVTPSFYGMIEQGSRNPRLPLALAMETLFGIPASELFPDLFYVSKPNALFGDEEAATAETVNQ